MKNLKKCLCAGLCIALATGLCACEKTAPESSSQPESSSVSSAAPSSDAPESSRFVPAPDLIPGSLEENSPFEDAFSQNPIDKKYDGDYALASSFSMMRQACNEAARNWKNMVETSFRAALEVTPAEGREALRSGQADWEEELDSRIEAIREKSGDDNEGTLTAAREVVLVYRDRAKELCKIKFEADGTLPEFPDPENEAASTVG